jgi:hypothetical protein
MSNLPLPEKPEKLPKSASVAERQERKTLMNERKRFQDKANKKKRPRGAERSKEEIDGVAASNISSNGKRVKSGDHGGHRDGAGRKPEDDVANSFRRGDPKDDLWPLKLFRNGEMYAHLPLKKLAIQLKSHTFRYSGDNLHGVPHGQGKLTLPNGEM